MLSEKRREIVRRSQAKRRAEFKANGLCVQCGERKPVKGKTLCESCAMKQNAYQKKYNEGKRCSRST